MHCVVIPTKEIAIPLELEDIIEAKNNEEEQRQRFTS